MRIFIEAKSKFGVLNSDDKRWYNTQDKSVLANFKIGSAYDVTMGEVPGDDGKVRKQIIKAVEASGAVATAVLDKPVEAASNAPKAESKPAFVKKAFKAPFTKRGSKDVEKVDWAAKDRSQLVGGRSHDAAELVKVSLTTAVPMPKVLELYKEALKGVLAIADEMK